MKINPIFFATILILTSFLSPAQKIVTIAGTGVAGFSGDDTCNFITWEWIKLACPEVYDPKK